MSTGLVLITVKGTIFFIGKSTPMLVEMELVLERNLCKTCQEQATITRNSCLFIRENSHGCCIYDPVGIPS